MVCRKALPTGEEARNYITSKRVMSMVEQGLAEMLETQPADPCGWLAARLKATNVLVKRSSTPVTLQGGAAVTLQWQEAAVHVESSVLPSVVNWRRAGGHNIWGVSLPSYEGWKRVIDHIKSTVRVVRKIVVVNVEKEDVVFYKGLPHTVSGYPEASLAEQSVVDALRAAGKTVCDVAQAVQDAAKSREQRNVELEFASIRFDCAAVAPPLKVYDEVAQLVERNRTGILSTGATVVLVTSLSGGDDVTVAMSLLYALTHSCTSLRTAAAQKNAWKESLRDRALKEKATLAAIASMHQANVRRDTLRIQRSEEAARMSPGSPAADEERAEREREAARIRAARQAQWEKLEAHLQAKSSTKIAAVYRGHAERKKKHQPLNIVPLPVVKKPRHQRQQKGSKGHAGPRGPSVVKKATSDITTDVVAGFLSVARCVRFFEAKYGNLLLRRTDEKRTRRRVTRTVIRVNPRAAESDDNEGSCSESLFNLEVVEEEEDQVPTDFAIPTTGYLTLLCKDLSQGRNIGAALMRTSQRFAGVAAVQARVQRTVDLVVHGMCFYVWSLLRDAAGMGDLFPVRAIDPSLASASFSDWFTQRCQLYYDMLHPHLLATVPNRHTFELPFVPSAAHVNETSYREGQQEHPTSPSPVHHAPVQAPSTRHTPCPSAAAKYAAVTLSDGTPKYPMLTDRTLAYFATAKPPPVGAGAARASLPTAKQPEDAAEHAKRISIVEPKTDADGAVRRPVVGAAFQRYHKRLQLYSLGKDVADKDEAADLLKAGSPSLKLVLWFSLTPNLTMWVRPVGGMSLLYTPIAPQAPSAAMQAITALCSMRAREVREAPANGGGGGGTDDSADLAPGSMNRDDSSAYLGDGASSLKKDRKRSSKALKGSRRKISGLKEKKESGSALGAAGAPSEEGTLAGDVDACSASSSMRASPRGERASEGVAVAAAAAAAPAAPAPASVCEEQPAAVPTLPVPCVSPVPQSELSGQEVEIIGNRWTLMEDAAIQAVREKWAASEGAGISYKVIGVDDSGDCEATLSPVAPVSEMLSHASAESGVPVLYVRQAVLPGASPHLLKTLDRMADMVSGGLLSVAATAEKEAAAAAEGGGAAAAAGAGEVQFGDLGIVVGGGREGHGGGSGVLLQAAAYAAFVVLVRRHTGEDVVDYLAHARRVSEAARQSAGRTSAAKGAAAVDVASSRLTPKTGVFTERSSLSQRTDGSLETDEEGEETESGGSESEIAYSTEDEGYSLTQRLMVSNPTVFGEVEGFDVERVVVVLSPFKQVDDLAKSELGAATGIPDAIVFVDRLLEFGNNSIQESLIGRLSCAIELFDEPARAAELDRRDAKRIAQQAARDLESYGLLLFYAAWLLASARHAGVRFTNSNAKGGVKGNDEGDVAREDTWSLGDGRPPELDGLPEETESAPQTASSFYTWMVTDHPGAMQWLLTVDPWGGDPHCGIQQEWLTHYQRWRENVCLRV